MDYTICSRSGNLKNTERVIGTWINGKPIYQKVLNDIVSTSWYSTSSVFLLSPVGASVDEFVNIFAALMGNLVPEQDVVPLPWVGDGSSKDCIYVVGCNNSYSDTSKRNKAGVQYLGDMRSWSSTGLRVRVIVQYTKTTD